jgi:hypothetical protein
MSDDRIFLRRPGSNPVIHLKVDGDDACPDIFDREIVDCGTVIHMAALGSGMASGKPSVAVRVDLPDRPVTVIVQTSLAALETVVRALVARYGSQTGDPPVRS